MVMFIALQINDVVSIVSKEIGNSVLPLEDHTNPKNHELEVPVKFASNAVFTGEMRCLPEEKGRAMAPPFVPTPFPWCLLFPRLTGDLQ